LSFRVLIVPEDPRNNGYILDPLVARILVECGKPNARVSVLTNPRAQGYEHAKQVLKDQVLMTYGRQDLVLFLPDADGKDRSQAFSELEAIADQTGVHLLCCAAVQEVETWLLAGHTEKLDRTWSEVRNDESVKEHVFMPFLERYGDPKRAGGGRDILMKETLSNYRGLTNRCPELQELESRICRLIESLIAS
jgi:hypothetical protein